MKNDDKKNYDDQVEGRNSVLELLESGKDVNKIFVSDGEKTYFSKTICIYFCFDHCCFGNYFCGEDECIQLPAGGYDV